MNSEETAIRLAKKLIDLTTAEKLEWQVTNYSQILFPDQPPALETKVGDSRAEVSEIPIRNSSVKSYSFSLKDKVDGMAEVIGGANDIFKVFAEGVPTDPTPIQRELWSVLKSLYSVAHDSARGTKKKVEQFEQLLERLA